MTTTAPRGDGGPTGATPPAGSGGARARVIAFYLPQYHPIAENDEWWGPGFTEWTNVASARRRFPGHYQPHVPADLGFYDLRLPEARIAQADLARRHGIAAFCYWHYWFAGRRVLERPFSEVLRSGEPDFPFCLAWANQTWTGIWHGAPGRVLIEQTYPGPEDTAAHFEVLAEAFADPRYLRVGGRPLLYVYRSSELPDVARTVDDLRSRAERAGFGGLYLVGERNSSWEPTRHGFDASVSFPLPAPKGPARLVWQALRRVGVPYVASYRALNRRVLARLAEGSCTHPGIIPGWDNSPRSGARGRVVHGATPEGFRVQVRAALDHVAARDDDERLVFVKSWNEWAEGNHLEPDRRHGSGFLQVIADEVLAGDRR